MFLKAFLFASNISNFNNFPILPSGFVLAAEPNQTKTKNGPLKSSPLDPVRVGVPQSPHLQVPQVEQILWLEVKYNMYFSFVTLAKKNEHSKTCVLTNTSFLWL